MDAQPTRVTTGLGWRAAGCAIGVGMVTVAATPAGVAVGWVVLAVAVLPLRWLLAYCGLALIRAYVVRRTKGYAVELGPPGKVADPDAAWRAWLATRCRECGA